MFPSSEHPFSEHRNAIGLQRASAMEIVGQEVAKLRVMGYGVDADRLADQFTERWMEWGVDGQD